MEHAEALEQIEIAAVEPDGLDRLMAGDTPMAAAVAGHLAGCPECGAELARIRRTAELARAAIRSQPDPALRDRTLAFVRAVGRDRGTLGSTPVAAAPAAAATAAPAAPAAAPAPAELAAATGPASPVASATPVPARRERPRWSWIAAAAAIVIVAAGGGYLAGGSAGDRTVNDRDAQIALLTDAAETAVRIQAQPDAQQIALTATPDAPGAAGTITLSASDGELVALATDLPVLAGGQEYGCWVEVDGHRLRLGRMYWAGGVWSWAGPVSGLTEVPAGSVFGVSMGPAGGGSDATPMLAGAL